MSWAPLLLVLSAFCAGTTFGLSLTQPPSVSAPPGEVAKLPCTMSRRDTARVSWYQQKFGSAPKFVYHFRSSGDEGRGQGVDGRFSVSHDAPSSLWNLVISGVLAEDQADYYCALWHASASTYIFGGGTQLNVLSGETKTPALNVFPPSSEEVATNKATLVCLLSDFYPGSVTVTWKADDQAISSGVETTRPSKQTDNNLFMASSYLSVPAADWSTGKKYTCQATHESKIIEKSVKHSECV